jgi:hypothetical protein
VLNLATPTSVLQLVAGVGASSIDCYVSYVDLVVAVGKVTPGAQPTAVLVAGVSLLAAAPSAGVDRNIKFITVQNKGGVTVQVTIQHDDGVTTINLFSIPLPTGWTVQYNSDGVGFVVYDQFGSIQAA